MKNTIFWLSISGGWVIVNIIIICYGYLLFIPTLIFSIIAVIAETIKLIHDVANKELS